MKVFQIFSLSILLPLNRFQEELEKAELEIERWMMSFVLGILFALPLKQFSYSAQLCFLTCLYYLIHMFGHCLKGTKQSIEMITSKRRKYYV